MNKPQTSPTSPKKRTLKIETTSDLVVQIVKILFMWISIPAGLIAFLYLKGTLQTWDWNQEICEIQQAQILATADRAESFHLQAQVSVAGREIISGEALRHSISGEQIDYYKTLYAPGYHARCFVDPNKQDFIMGRSPEIEIGILMFGAIWFLILPLGSIPYLLSVLDYFRRKKQSATNLPKARNLDRLNLLVSISVAALAIIVNISGQTFTAYYAEKSSQNWNSQQCEIAMLGPEQNFESLVYDYDINGTRYRSSDYATYGIRSLTSTEDLANHLKT